MLPETRVRTRDEMMKRVALFKDLIGNKGGLPDSHLPEAEKEIFNVIGFQPPPSEGEGGGMVNSPVGADAARNSAIQISEGFNMGVARCKPGCGPLMHNHDTNETFTPVSGTWRCARNEGDDYEYIDAGPSDVISFRPNVIRRFECIEPAKGEETALVMFVVAGDAPANEFSEDARNRMAEVPVPA
jgi:quercetin dioxygenase-like cupin family protein